MTRELRNAVSRLRKLQDAAFAGKIDCPSINVGLSFYNHKYESGDYASVDVVISIFDEYNMMEKHLMYCMSEKRCYQCGKCCEQDLTIDDVLHEIAVAVDYPV